MKKLIALFAVALSVGAFAADSYLYWMVEEGAYVTWEGSAVDYNAARVGVVATSDSDFSSATYLSLYNMNGANAGDSAKNAYAFTASVGTGSLYALVSDTYQTTGYSFFIELMNDGVAVARSNASSMLDWSSLKAYTTSTIGTTSAPGNGWNGGTFAAVPEPTSGLLVLLGVAGLTLRRRRMAKA